MTIRPVIKQDISADKSFIHFLTNSFKIPGNRVASLFVI